MWISYAKCNLTCKIDISEQEYKVYENCISSNEHISNNEPVQIFITPPPVEGDDLEILTIKGNMNIMSESYESLILPFEFVVVNTNCKNSQRFWRIFKIMLW